jgi:hypothetical protein
MQKNGNYLKATSRPLFILPCHYRFQKSCKTLVDSGFDMPGIVKVGKPLSQS